MQKISLQTIFSHAGVYFMKKKRIPGGVKICLAVIFLSVMTSAFIISAANDAFALVKAGTDSTITLDEDDSVIDMAKKLKKAGVIRYPLAFAAYTHLRFGDKLTAGDYTVNGGMSYDEIRRAVTPKKNGREQFRLTIPEGYTTDAIIDLFVKNGVGTREKFAEVINSYDFDFDFVRAIPAREGRTYRLDGYLFPDTYFFYKDSSEVEAIGKLLRNFDNKFGKKLREDAASSGISCDDAVILASIIEKEAYFKEDMPKISSVFHNRLAGSRKYLESDATVRYFLAVSGEDASTFTAEQMKIENPYNTYRSEGLPPGAICNAGADALYAAIYPEKTDYFYFVCDKNNNAVYSRTYSEHLRAVRKIRGQ